MSGIIEFLISYIAIVIFWLIFNIFFYALTVATRKSFFFIPFAINTLLTWAIEIYFIIYPFYYIWLLIKSNLNLGWWIIVALILGLFALGFILYFMQMIVGFLTLPIGAITAYFSEQSAKKLEDKEDYVDYEYISPQGKVIGKYSSLSKMDQQFTKWFVICFVILFVHQFTTQSERSLGPIWHVIIPMIVLIIASCVVGIFLGMWNLLRRRKFLGDDKRVFITKCLKVESIIYGLSIISNLILG